MMSYPIWQALFLPAGGVLKGNEDGLRRGIHRSLDRDRRELRSTTSRFQCPVCTNVRRSWSRRDLFGDPGTPHPIDRAVATRLPKTGPNAFAGSMSHNSVPSPSRAPRPCLAGLKRRAALLTFRLIKRRLKNSGRLPQVSGPLSFQRRQSPLRRLLRRQVPVLGRC